MKRLYLVMLLLINGPLVSSFSAADDIGFDYLPDADAVVFGGLRYSYRTTRPDDVHLLYMRQIGSNTTTVLYRSEGGLTDIRASSQGRFVGVLERLWEENVSPERANFVDRVADGAGGIVEFHHLDVSRLLIIDQAGVVRDTIDDVRRYAWDPGNQRVVYITGKYREGGPFGFDTTGTWLFDVPSGQRTRIYDQGMEVEWARWDGGIYIYDPFPEGLSNPHVLRFNPDTSELSTTLLEGIHFSPTGRFYFGQGYEGSPPLVFRTETGEQLDTNFSIASSGEKRIAGFARGWLNDVTLIVPSPDPNKNGDFLYNIETGTLRYGPGSVMGIMDSTGSEEGLVMNGESILYLRDVELEAVRP